MNDSEQKVITGKTMVKILQIFSLVICVILVVKGMITADSQLIASGSALAAANAVMLGASTCVNKSEAAKK